MSKKILTWLRSNWMLIILIMILIIIVRSRGTDNREYKREIKAMDDSIIFLNTQYQQIEDLLSVSREITTVALEDAKLSRDSIKIIEKKNTNLKYKHAIEVANFKKIPTDTLYLDYTRWIDSVSFE